MQNLLKLISTIILIIIALSFNVSAQIVPQSLTNYESERKSLNFVDQYKEFVLVENGDFLSVLSIDDDGQLYVVYGSNIPYCSDGSIINVDINKDYILYFYGDNVLIENYITGTTKNISNLYFGVKKYYPMAYFLGNSEFIIKNDSSYVYSIDADTLIESNNQEYIVNNDIVFYLDNQNNQTVVTFFKENKVFKFSGFFPKQSNMFDGLIFQRSFNNDWSTENHIYFVNKNATVDTILGFFPIFDIIDKDPNKSSILLGQQHFFEMSIKLYKYDLNTKNLATIDSLPNYDYYGNYYSDSIFYYSNYSTHNFYNLKTNENKTVNLCSNYHLHHSLNSNLFYFQNYGSSPLMYDLKQDKVFDIVNESFGSDVYFTKFFKGDKLYLVDLQYLNLPYYEISDQLKILKHQNILPIADNNGIRTSLLKETKDFVYTFDDDDIIVLDTTLQNGYRKKKIINPRSILGTLKGINWQTYENNIYGVIPNIKGTQKHFDLIKINLENLEVTNISESKNWIDTINFCGQRSPIYPVNNFPNDFLILDKRILNLRTDESFNIPDTMFKPPYREAITAKILNSKLIVFSYRKIAEFSYPSFNFIRSFDIKSIVHNKENFYSYRKGDNTNLIVSDGVDDFILSDTEDYRNVEVNGLTYKDNIILLRNSKTEKIRIYKVLTSSNGNILVEKEFEDSYTNVTNQIQPKSNNFCAFSFNRNDEKLHTYIFNLDSKSVFRFNGIDQEDIVYFNGNELICIDNKVNQVIKFDIKGNILESLPYPSGSDFFYNIQRLNFDHSGLFVFDRYDMKNNNSKLFFNADKFEFVFDTECKQEYFKYSSLGENVIYKNNAYYFNAELDGRGRQIYKIKNDVIEGPTSTKNQNIKPLSLHPNPAGDFIGINIENPCDIRSVHIFDLLGYQHKVNYNNCQNQVDVSGLNQGAYFVKIDHLGGSQTLKFLKM